MMKNPPKSPFVKGGLKGNGQFLWVFAKGGLKGNGLFYGLLPKPKALSLLNYEPGP